MSTRVSPTEQLRAEIDDLFGESDGERQLTSRLARARQREAVRARRDEWDSEADVASPWGFVVILGGGAVWCLWQARQIPKDDDPAHVAARRRWILAGFLCAGLAIGLASSASGGDLESR